MINREKTPIIIIHYTDNIDGYGQTKKNVKEKVASEMVVHIYSQTNVTNPKYVDIDYLGIYNPQVNISIDDDIIFNNNQCSVMYIVPANRYNIVYMKKK